MVIIDVQPEQFFESRCKWCNCFLGYTLVENSDGICPECSSKELERFFYQRALPFNLSLPLT